METNVLLDVAELALKHLKKGSTVTYVNIDDFYEKYSNGGGLCKVNSSKDIVKKSLITIFPIYKNRRKNTNDYKISSRTAYFSCEALGVKLRPLKHIQSEKL